MTWDAVSSRQAVVLQLDGSGALPLSLERGDVLALHQIITMSSLKDLMLKINLAYKHVSKSLGIYPVLMNFP